MTAILLKGFLLFLLCQCLHIIIWRIKRPTAYPIWLPLIFIFLPLAGFIGYWLVKSITMPENVFRVDEWIEWFGIFLFHVALSSAYTMAYPGVVSFSPSLEMLKVLSHHPSQGLPGERLILPAFHEDRQIGVRIANLVASRMIVEENGEIRLTTRGQRIASVFRFYRHLFGLPEGGGG